MASKNQSGGRSTRRNLSAQSLYWRSVLEFRIKKTEKCHIIQLLGHCITTPDAMVCISMCGSRGGGGAGGPDPLKKSQNIWFLSNSGPDPLTNHTAVSQHSMLGHHQHTSEMPFKWRFAGGPMVLAYSGIWIFPPLIIKKNVVKVGPPLTKFSGSEHDLR